MLGPTNCAVVIPYFNEGASIAALVQEVRQQVPRVMVVDDGSTDDTAALAAAAGAMVLSHARNLGKGAALRTGLSAALTQGFERVLTMDGDGQHQPQDVPALLRCAEQTLAPLVVGNRMHHPQAIPWLRRQVNRWMSRRLSERAGRLLPDSQCGFRLVDLKVWAGLPLQTDHFEIESEMLLAFVRAGYRVEFVPIQVVSRAEAATFDRWRTPGAGGNGGGISISLRHGRFKLEAAPGPVRQRGVAPMARSDLQQKPRLA